MTSHELWCLFENESRPFGVCIQSDMDFRGLEKKIVDEQAEKFANINSPPSLTLWKVGIPLASPPVFYRSYLLFVQSPNTKYVSGTLRIILGITC